MSREQYEDNCPGCQPVLIDPRNGKKLPDDDPAMVAVNKMWKETTLEERHAFHRFTCDNSRTPEDMAIISDLTMRMQQTLKALEEKPN